MTPELQAALATALLIVATWCVFGGLDLFKAYVQFCGFVVGLPIGALLGAMIGAQGSLEAAGLGGVIGALVGGSVGAAVAWPLKKIVVALTGGLCVGVLSSALLLGAGANAGALPGVFGLAFVAGAVAAFVFYDYAVIVSMGLLGAQIAGYAINLGRIRSAGSLGRYYDNVLAALAENLMLIVTTTAIYVWFALVMQKGSGANRETDSAQAQASARLFRRCGYLMATAAILGFAASIIFPAGFIAGKAPILIAKYRFQVSCFTVFGFGLTSWPLVAYAAAIFLKNIPVRWTARAGTRLLGCIVFCMVIAPPIGWALATLVGLKPAPPTYYRSFLWLFETDLLVKWALAVAVLPSLLCLLWTRTDRHQAP